MGNGKLIKCTPLANSATEQLFFLGKNFFEIYFNGPIFITFTDYFLLLKIFKRKPQYKNIKRHVLQRKHS